MKSSQIPIARKDGLVIQETTDEVLVYDLTSNKAHCLNQTAAFVWKSCDGNNSISDITNRFQKEIGSSVHEDLVWLAIDQLNDKNLLEKDLTADFAGRSRREVIKKIGLAAVIALPIVASLTAPSSAMAASSCVCNSPGNCTAQPTCPAMTCNPGGLCAP
jgi:Coenzyme PQQ synthesis protein D (PqqD)